MRALAAVLALALFGFAAVQLNDPDPLGWTAIYASAALVSLAFAARRTVRPYAGALASIALVWALTLVPEALQLARLADVTARMDIMRPEIEIARELGGLTIVLVWMATLALSPRATRPSSTARPPAPPHRAPTPTRS
ncbi:MAG: transmembrane 220 family protein [Polyangiales bacterium]